MKMFLVVSALFLLSGCGGDFQWFPESDHTPDAFTFTTIDDAPFSTEVESDPVVVTGIGSATPISVTGGEYSVNGKDFTFLPGTVLDGDIVRARHKTAATGYTTKTTVVTIGERKGTFSSITGPDDVPASMTFTPTPAEPEPGGEVLSDVLTVTGIDVAVPVTIVGGWYSIDGGPWTADPGMISSGQTLQLRQIAADTYETPTVTTVRIGPESREVVALMTTTTVAEPVAVP